MSVPQLSQSPLTKTLLNFQMQLASSDSNMKFVLSPFANATLAEQLVNPGYGSKAPELIKAFAAAVADLAGNDKVKKSAELVRASVDGVTAARNGDQAQMSQALTQFAKSFDSLQTQAEDIQAGR